jgi:hypothetical protein
MTPRTARLTVPMLLLAALGQVQLSGTIGD